MNRIVKCNIKGCKKRIITDSLKAGQTVFWLGDKIEAYCSELHWEQHLTEVLPHH